MAGFLTEKDGAPVAVENADAGGPIVLVCEHASRRLPEKYGNLGLPPDALDSHIAWDPGALAVSRMLSQHLDAALIHQRFSRLIYDCNRPPDVDAAMPAVSEVHEIPGNAEILPEERQARAEALYFPFRDAISSFIARRKLSGHWPVLVTMHTFTPVYHGRRREVELGILHDSDKRLADTMLTMATKDTRYDIRRNEPYGPSDGVTHTLIEQGVKNGLLNVMIEIRNDLVSEDAGQKVMAGYLAELLGESLAALQR